MRLRLSMSSLGMFLSAMSLSAMSLLSVSVLALAASSAASADPYVIPGIAPDHDEIRPGYRQAQFPPPPHDIFGNPIAPTGDEPRPSYRQATKQFPPPGGRYGGGFIEFVMTGGRPEPIAPQYNGIANGLPVYSVPEPQRASLPPSSLPDYAPQPTAYYGSAAPEPQASERHAYNVPRDPYEPAATDTGAAADAGPVDPTYQRQMVTFAGSEKPGTIVIDTPNKFLYLVQPGRQAIRYGIGVGRPGFEWSGVKHISRKAEWPGWTPPREMVARRPDLPRHMDGGPRNPLGARAMYLGSSLYRIHGTNEPQTIGTNVSSGCIRMMNHDVIDLYGRVGLGTRVVVL